MNCRDREGNVIGAAFDEDGYCDTCHRAYGRLRASVETYVTSKSDGTVEEGYTVKVGDDSLADYPTQAAAQLHADAYNGSSRIMPGDRVRIEEDA